MLFKMHLVHWADHMSCRLENNEYRTQSGMMDNVSDAF